MTIIPINHEKTIINDRLTSVLYHIHNDLLLLLKKSFEEKVFTSCEVSFFWRKESVFYKYTLCLHKGKFYCRPYLYFDLASLTKILVTIPCFLSLLSQREILIDDTINSFFLKSEKWGNTPLINLINHTSGLPSHILFSELLNIEENKRFETLENYIFKENFQKDNKNIIYSDLGYLLLGRVVEKVSGVRLDEYWHEKIAIPLNLYDLFFPYQRNKSSAQYVLTGQCVWTGEALQGIVHDDNCRMLGGVCGHAGLFGNSFGVLNIMKSILQIYKEEIISSSFSSRVLQECLNCKVLTRRFGFDTPAKKKSSCGNFFSDMTIGHLGFTGTSVWMDIKKEVCVVLLTNRTIAGDDLSAIRNLRPKVHDIIMKNIPYKGNSL